MDANAMPLVTRPVQKPNAYIYRLPSELLYIIFTFLFDLPWGQYPTRKLCPSGKEFLHPVLIVRWVCAWFRKIASQHGFWLEAFMTIPESLCNLDIFDGSFTARRFLHYLPHYLHILLMDPDLRNCLRRRTTWNFVGTGGLLDLLDEGSSFYSKTEGLCIRDVQDIPFARMASFTGLTSLCISFLKEYSSVVDLDAIAAAFPLLEKLEVNNVDDSFGTLEPLQNVRSLHYIFNYPVDVGTYDLSSLLPSRSAHCLTHLALFLPEDLDSEWPPKNPFKSFTHISNLAIYVSHTLEYIPWLLNNAGLPIHTLELKQDDQDDFRSDQNLFIPVLKRLFGYEIFSKVKSLRLAVRTFQNGFDSCHDFPGLLVGLRDLECLELAGFVMPWSWWQCFGKMPNLGYLQVAIDPQDFVMDDEDEVDDERLNKVIVAEAEWTIGSTFGNGHRKIHIIVNKWDIRNHVPYADSELLIDKWF